MNAIPQSLLGEVRRLAEKQNGPTPVAPTNLGQTPRFSSTGPSMAPAGVNTLNAAGTLAQKLSTRAKGFAVSRGGDALPQFTSSSDVFAAPATAAASPVLARPTPAPHAAARPPQSYAPLVVTTNASENAFRHAETARRVAHLTGGAALPSPPQQPPPASAGATDLAFLYESSADGPSGDARRRDKQGSAGASTARGHFKPEELSIVVPKNEVSERTDEGQPQHISLKPATRKEVALLKHTMIALLNDIGCSVEQEYPTDMHAFLAMIQEEQKIYDTVFQELIRQVTINMVERGEVLAEIRRRYANMFTKIPKHVKHLHTELVAQRKLNRRLSEELLRSKETVADLWTELDVVRKHDVEVTKQAQDAQEKLVSVLTQSDNTDEILEEYHKLYKMQRERLEEGVRNSEKEKKMWIDAAQNLALRIGQEHGIIDLAQLLKIENSRLRSSNHAIVIISNTNDAEMTAIEGKIEEWRVKLLKLSQTVIDEDNQNIDVLTKIQRSMKLILKNLIVNEPKDPIESDHPMLKAFHLFDVRSLSENLMKWVEHITSVAVRFTSDSDLVFREEITVIRKIAEQWLEAGTKLLHRNEKNTNSKDYVPLTDVLSKIGHEIEEWLGKLESRISGEEGVASLIIGLQNQLEDRYTAFSARDFDKPLPASERAQLKESLVHWTEQIVKLTETLSDTCEKEQQKVPLHVENWVSRVLDQMNTDTDVRNEENHKLHTAMISWMVHLLIKSGREKPSESWDHEFLQLTQEIMAFNMNLARDSSDIEMISDDNKNLRDEIQRQSDSWIGIAKRLLALQRKSALRAVQHE